MMMMMMMMNYKIGLLREILPDIHSMVCYGVRCRILFRVDFRSS